MSSNLKIIREYMLYAELKVIEDKVLSEQMDTLEVLQQYST